MKLRLAIIFIVGLFYQYSGLQALQYGLPDVSIAFNSQDARKNLYDFLTFAERFEVFCITKLTLDVKGTELVPSEVNALLAGLAKFTHLTTLDFDLCYDGLGEEGIVSILTSLAKCASLKHLSFSVSGVGMEQRGIGFMSAIEDCIGLTMVSLDVSRRFS